MLGIVVIIIVLWGLTLSLIWLGGGMLIKRRTPDAPADPAQLGLPYEAVSFPSRYKATLTGWWIPAAQPKGTLIFCHGQNGSMEADLPQAVPLHQAGYNVLMFNFRAHGTSEGKKVTFGVFEKEDLLGAIDFLHTQKGIAKVTLLGMSMGAGVALITAALTDKVQLLILDGIFYKFIWVVQRAFAERLPTPLAFILAQLAVLGAALRTNTRLYQVSPSLWAKHLDQKIPVLFIHAEHDQFTTLEEVKQLAGDLQGEYQLWVAPGCRHRQAFQKHPAEYIQQVLAWLAAHP